MPTDRDNAPAALGCPVCVAMTGQRGAPLAVTRMDGAPVRSLQLSEAKAYSAAALQPRSDR